MNKDIMLEKIEYLSSMPHFSLVEHCIYLENENDNYKAQKYITDFISENGIICEKNKEIKQLKEKIDKANEILSNILVIKRSDGNYGAVKNTTKQEVYEVICMLNEILGTPHRTNYNLLGDKENE